MTLPIMITFMIIAIASCFAFFALLKSSVAMEKMVAIDVLTTITAGFLMILSIVFESSFLLDITLVYAVLSFGAVLVLARYHEGGI